MGMRSTTNLSPRFSRADHLFAILFGVAALSLSAPVLAADNEGVPQAPNLPGADTAEEAKADQIEQLTQQMAELSARLKQTEEQQRANATSPLSIHGYVDFGFFAPIGNRGVGFIEDVGNKQTDGTGRLPDLTKYSWTFLGDILATAVNTRGEVASLGHPPAVTRFDSINSEGAPGFIANEVNLRLGYALTERAQLHTNINFMPRSGHEFNLGDFVDVDLAEVEYVATSDGNTSVFAGKIMPVFGIEYKERRSDQRFGITPSLIQRYTSGSQLGVKVRSKLFNQWIIVAASATNDSSGTEQFHFQSEIDRNSGKTINGRLALSIPIGTLVRGIAGDKLELGGSGEIGPQDWATDNSGNIWFVGVDLQYLSTNFALKAQWIKGKAPGTSDGTAWQLDLHNSGYVEFNWQVIPLFGFLLRAEQRDAFVAQGLVRAYLTKERRYTIGARAVLNPHVMAKVEYFKNQEYGGIAEFKNDMFTSSLVLSY